MIRRNCAWLIAIVALNAGYIPGARADAAADRATFQAIFSAWTQAFNEKRHPQVCTLFARTLVADYQGAQTKDYASICNGFKRLFEEEGVHHRNDFRIHQVYRSNDFAAVRITWYLDIYKDGAHLSSVQEEGLDVFQKQDNGQWEIVNFIAYPAAPGK